MEFQAIPKKTNIVEATVESLIVNVRWLLAPLYVGMAISMLVFVVKFFQELYHLLSNMIVATEAEWVLGVLALIDNVLVANLVVMVLISGYETFVSPISFGRESDRPGWLSGLDPGTVKVKLASSIVGISIVHLLGIYLKIGSSSYEPILWKVVFHIVFIFTALFLAYVDILVAKKHALGSYGDSAKIGDHPNLGTF